MFAPGTVLLHDKDAPGAPPARLFTAPSEILVAHTADEARAALKRLEAALAEGFWSAGFLAYELGYLFEERLLALLPPPGETPLVWLGLYDAPQRLSAAEVTAALAAHGPGMAKVTGIVPDRDFEAYTAAFDTVMAYIAAGDIYQANLTLKAELGYAGDPVALYRDLVASQPVSYGALIENGAMTILSRSPELFVSHADGRLSARPMKGTLARGRTLAEDEVGRRALAADPKSRAENLMIVDLLRNDLGRIARIGSVRVTDLFSVETFPSLHQMTSGITADLLPDLSLTDVLAGLFPCGSITGAPKIRAMEIIAETEAGPRGVYTGAIGYFAPAPAGITPDFTLSVAIRTALLRPDGTGEIGIGGGIVADSTAQAEYEEALLKMKFLADPAPAPGLIETLLWTPGEGFALLDRHLQRLAGSARYLAIPLPEGAANAALAGAAQSYEGRMRVRLLLGPDGTLSVTATPLPAPPDDYRFRFMLADERLDSTDPLLAHKTTRRDQYDLPRQRAAERFGVDEVVFCNERGELAEGSFTSLFIERGGVLLTPPLSAGILAGTLRAELLAIGRAREAVLYPADLEGGDRLYLGNSVRGLVPAILDAP